MQLVKNIAIRCAALATCIVTSTAFADSGYVQHNLVSDIAGYADRTEMRLVNAWGIVHGPATPWWVNANGTGLSFVYDGAGNPAPAASPIVVSVPDPSGTGAPSGIVFNGTQDFALNPGQPARFIFVTEQGTVSGWNPNADPHNAIIKFTDPAMGVYKGVAMGSMNGNNVLYVADFHNGTVDVFDANFAPVTLSGNAFQDAMIPPGFAPFNVQNVGGWIYVTYAKQDADRHDDVAGAGNGYVDRFTQDGQLVMRLEHGKWLNSPWGVTLAPAGFGQVSGRLLVGNFGSGQIASYDARSGEFAGMLRGRKGKPITIDGLWGLNFGNGGAAGPANVLYFAAGIQDEQHGLFGTLTPLKPQQGGDDNGGDQ